MTPNKSGSGTTAETGPCGLGVCGECISPPPKNCQKEPDFWSNSPFLSDEAKYFYQ